MARAQVKKRESKAQQSGVDKILSRLPKSCADEFLEWCWHKPSYTDMSRRLTQYVEENPACFEGLEEGKDYSLHVSIQICWNWYQREYPVGEEVKKFNETLRLFQGVEHEKIPQQLLVKLVRLSMDAIDRLGDENLAGVDSNMVLSSVPALVREIRSLTKLVDLQVKKETLHEDRMQAVHIAVMAILGTFKDQANEEAVKSAAIDAMIAAEEWSKNNLS
jgi:Cu/Ag efflux protein CusF